MRSLTYLSLITSVTAAQDTAVIFNPIQSESTLTAIGSDASATTYKNSCPPGRVGISTALSGVLQEPGATITPGPEVAPLLRQRDISIDFDSLCEPYTLTQGQSAYELHLTDPSPGVWTLDMACQWQGMAMTGVDLTCTVTQSGSIPGFGATGVSTTVLSSSELDNSDSFQTVAVLGALGESVSTRAPEATPSSRSVSGSGTTGGRSTGIAPVAPIPTGTIAFIGGAAGIFAAALAL